MKPFRAGTLATVVIGLVAIGYFMLRMETAPANKPPMEAAHASSGATHGTATTEISANNVSTNSIPRAALTTDAFEQLLATQPELAAAEVANLPEATELRDDRLARLMEVWVEKNPSQAADWATALPNGTFRDEAHQELGAAWGNIDAESAAQWAAQSLAGGQLIPAFALLSVWGRSDPDNAAKWLSDLSTSEETELDADMISRLTGALTYAWASAEPESAAKWVADQDDPGVRSRAIVNLAAGWAENDPGALAAWLRTNVPPGASEAQAAYVTLASQWADSQPEVAGQWAAALPSGDLRDTTLATFTSSLATSEPIAALQWSQQIEAPERRKEAALDIYETWLDDDLPTARDALIATIPTLKERAYQHDLYNLLHEKDPVFRDELYKLILPDDAPPREQDSNTTSPEPEVRRALPATEETVDVEEMAE
ncbi:MAG: hypothetical protein O3C21_00140 [Verrucomicrobia bacterium]|nr:hypothetical protein [Verrucomicrobiota bacterium]